MKDYQKPEFELISLITQEEITSGDGVIGGIPGVDSVPPDFWG